MDHKIKYSTGISRWFFRLVHFFPVQLLLGYLKNYQLLLLAWLIPFLITAKAIGFTFGLPSLFLTPEYLGHVGSYAFLFTGLAAGSFIMAFHISSYVVMANRYPFIVTVSKPFYVYSLNNSLIPAAYLLLYGIESYKSQVYNELTSPWHAINNLLFFLAGVIIFVYFSFGFFFLVVRVFPKIFSIKQETLEKHSWLRWIAKLSENEKEAKLNEAPKERFGVYGVGLYMRSFTRIAWARFYGHYTREQMVRVFRYQHQHAFYYVILILSFIILRGFIKDVPALILPAAASFHLIFTVILLVSSFFYIIFRKWTWLVLLGLVLLLTAISPMHIGRYNNNAYGMNYDLKNKTVHPREHGNFRADSLKTIQILNRWYHNNNPTDDPAKKPKMVIVCTSGGGLKMAYWTFYTLGYADSVLHGRLMKHIRLISGASGGMLGAAYLRELYLRYQEHKIKNYYSAGYLHRLSKDILNPIFYSFSMSDWFIRLQRFEYNGHRYYKDRAYMFEQTVNRNLGPYLNKPLEAYKIPEENAQIPMMVLTPTIMNVGTRLIISPIGVSYLAKTETDNSGVNIEFRYNYRDFEADKLNFLSAIRMNASFPYVSPFAALPGSPRITVFDAGLNDNFGYLTAYVFITEFSDWIDQNTSGVILIRLNENDIVNYNDKIDFLTRLTEPLGTLFVNWSNIQKNDLLPMLFSLNKILPGKVHFIHFSFGTAQKRISLSWHLTKREVQILTNAINNPQNQRELKRLKALMASPPSSP